VPLRQVAVAGASPHEAPADAAVSTSRPSRPYAVFGAGPAGCRLLHTIVRASMSQLGCDKLRRLVSVNADDVGAEDDELVHGESR
jgi:hypothetical protein